MPSIVDSKKKRNIYVGPNEVTPAEIYSMFGRNPNMTEQVAKPTNVAQPTAQISPAQSTADTAASVQARVDDYYRRNPKTGDPFKDIGGLLATRDDRRLASELRALGNNEADRSVTMRGQDIQRELGIGEIGVNTERNRLTRRGQDLEKEIEMRKADVTEKGYQQNHKVSMAEVGLNRDIFNATQDRYKKYGEPADKLMLGRAAAETGDMFEDIGVKPGNFMKGFTPEYLGDTSVATPDPTQQFKTSSSIPMPAKPAYSEVEEMTDFPQWLEPKAYTDYGQGLAVQTLGVANEIAKVPFRAVYHARKMLDPISEALGGPTLPKIYKRTRKVNK